MEIFTSQKSKNAYCKESIKNGVFDRWDHEGNRTREQWLGEDGFSFFAQGKKVYQFNPENQKDIELLLELKEMNEYEDNLFYDDQRNIAYEIENKRQEMQQSDSEETDPIEQIPDSRPSVEDLVLFEGQEEGPSKSEKLRDEFRQAVKETTTKHPEKYDLYLRRYDKGISVDQLVQERYEQTGKLVSNQAESDVFTNIVAKAYKHLTGKKELPKRRNR